MEDGDIVSMVLLGVLREWASREGIDLPSEQHLSQRMWDQLDADIMPSLDNLIRSKKHK